MLRKQATDNHKKTLLLLVTFNSHSVQHRYINFCRFKLNTLQGLTTTRYITTIYKTNNLLLNFNTALYTGLQQSHSLNVYRNI